MRTSPLLLALATCLAAPPALAARAPEPPAPASVTAPAPPRAPVMIVDPARAEKLGVRSLDVTVRVVGRLAETRMVMTFANPHGRALAGDLLVPLPAGATVSGYALDVGGQLVDGVVVDKDEARVIFETEVRKGVDPGLVEWVGANTFRTRVFPIPARGSRTVAVSWVSELDERDEGATYRLPLGFPDPVAAFSLRVEVVQTEATPVFLGRGRLAPAFGKAHGAWVAEVKLRDATLDRDVTLLVPAAAERPAQLERASDGRLYFAVRADAQAPADPAWERPRRVRLVWDASMSRATADHEREIALVERWLATLDAPTVDLVVLRDAAEPAARFSLPADRARLGVTLRGLAYDGGTQLAAAALPPSAAAPDVTVLVSDGVSNFGAADPGDLRSPVFSLTTATAANHDLLRRVARASGGAHFDLARLEDAVALARLGRPTFSLLAARVAGAPVRDLLPALPEPVVGPAVVTGVLEGDQATITLDFGVGERVTRSVDVVVRAADATEGDLLRRFWASQRVRDLLGRPGDQAEAIKAIGKRHGVVTPGTSLLVLETLEQYVEHEVRPPAMLAAMRASWDEAMAARAQQDTAKRADRLARVLAAWGEEVAWWQTTFDYPKDFRYAERSENKRAGGGTSASEAASDEREADEDSAPSPMAPSQPLAREEAGKKKDGGDSPGPEAAIALTKWDPDTPYLRAIAAAPAPSRYRVYLEQRASFGGSPAFYLDCADALAKEDPRLGLRILSNLAELGLEEPALLRVLGHRLAQLDELDLAVIVFDEVKRLRPEEPQSWRDLALVLGRRAVAASAVPEAARADFARATELFAALVMGEWARFDGVEIIALTELNAMWPRARAAGVARWPLDPRLERRLDLDVRVVMTWDADLTDMDLHVVEPSGEEAYYGHARTTIGGKVSRDITDGYGPEVYSLRRAMNGSYKLKAKFYGSSAAQLIGAVTLQVEVFTNFGRLNQQRRATTFRLTERNDEFAIGEIEL